MKRLFLVLVLLMVSCSSVETSEVTPHNPTILIQDNVYRFIDKEADVVCWVYAQGYKGGISCLPLSETNLVWSN